MDVKTDKMAWFREAKFGMFIHFGLYSRLKKGEWIKNFEGIGDAEYESLADGFAPDLNCAKQWARTAKAAGMKYVVFTSKHHDGFCLFDTQHTDFNSVKTGSKRDYVREVVDAFRAEGLRIGIYYSIGDWHEKSWRDENAPGYASFMKGQIRELLTQYGQIDMLWYDGGFFTEKLTPETLGLPSINTMAGQLQPGILINERSGSPEDFSCCENECRPSPRGRDWEMCICINDIWGYCEHDYNYKTVNQLIFLLANCASQGGNLLLNVGPRPDGSIPGEQVARLEAMGKWLKTNGESIYGSERPERAMTGCGRVTAAGDAVYIHALYWFGKQMRLQNARRLFSKVSAIPQFFPRFNSLEISIL